MRTLVFDIETVGEEWESLDQVTQQELTAWVDRTVSDQEQRALRIADIKERLSLSPFTGVVVSLAVYDVERGRGAVYYSGSGADTESVVDGFVYKERSEAALLQEFWVGAADYDVFISFCGRAFDVPFLLHRSLAHSITPSQDLLRRRYLSQQKRPYHIDLQDELTFYGAMRRSPSLHMLCRTYGIDSPKQVASGADVTRLYHEGKYVDIAKHNVEDVIATNELYKKWCTHLAPKPFRLL